MIKVEFFDKKITLWKKSRLSLKLEGTSSVKKIV